MINCYYYLLQTIDTNLNTYCNIVFAGAGIVSTYNTFVTPTKSLERCDESYEIEIPAYHQSFIDLRGISLYVRGRLIRLDKEEEKVHTLVADERVFLINNTLHSLFESVTVQIGGNQVNEL